MAESELELAEAIAAVRAQLRQAQDQGLGADVRFAVGSVEVEFAVEATKTGGGEASVKVLNLLSLGAKAEVARALTNRVKVVLNPIGVGGQPFEVASPRRTRPDVDETGGGGDAPGGGQ